MLTSISAGVGDLPCLPTFFLWSLIELKIPNTFNYCAWIAIILP